MRRGVAATAVLLVLVGLVAAGTKDTGERPQAAPTGPQEAEVTAVLLDPQSQQPVVILQGKRDKRNLVMTIGFFEAERIAIPLQGVTPARPLTHDLFVSLLADLRTPLRRIVITDLREDVYYALLHLEGPGGVLTIDSRPSDAIALALRARVPILIEDRVFDKAERIAPKAGRSPHF